MKNYIRHSITAIMTTGLLSSSAMAQSTSYNDDDSSGLFIGASYGHLRVDGDDEFDDNKDAYQGTLGYGFNDYFALEASYIDFGDYGNDIANAATDGYTLGIRLGLPITNNFSIYARGGQLWYETDYDVLGVNDSTEDEGLYAGLGLGYQLNEDWTLKIDYTLYDSDLNIDSATDDIDDANFSTDLKHAAIGFEYKF
jgi:opacity protein-like surface antigen